jgi:hypothetical protein
LAGDIQQSLPAGLKLALAVETQGAWRQALDLVTTAKETSAAKALRGD